MSSQWKAREIASCRLMGDWCTKERIYRPEALVSVGTKEKEAQGVVCAVAVPAEDSCP